MPLVSIILPTRDRPGLLSRAVRSALGQTETDFEVLVVDNNRATPPVREDAASGEWIRDPRVSVLGGSSARNAASARNAGLAAARGSWIAYLDDDDAYRPEKLARQIAAAGSEPVVLCGALVHLKGRTRPVQVGAAAISGDSLLNEARWGTQLLMHRSTPALRFDEELYAAEDLHFGQRLLAHFDLGRVPVAREVLVDIYQDRADDARTNLRAGAGWHASRKVLVGYGARYSRRARRLFLLRAMTARAKLERRTLRCAALGAALVREGGPGQARYALNAFLVGAGLGRGRWVT